MREQIEKGSLEHKGGNSASPMPRSDKRNHYLRATEDSRCAAQHVGYFTPGTMEVETAVWIFFHTAREMPPLFAGFAARFLWNVDEFQVVAGSGIAP